MKPKLYLFALLLLFLFVAYFLISHAYVFVRLTTILGFFGVIVILLALVGYLFGRIR